MGLEPASRTPVVTSPLDFDRRLHAYETPPNFVADGCYWFQRTRPSSLGNDRSRMVYQDGQHTVTTPMLIERRARRVWIVYSEDNKRGSRPFQSQEAAFCSLLGITPPKRPKE